MRPAPLLAAWLCALASALPGGVRAELLGCLIEPDRVAEVGSHSIGVIEQLQVERGDVVRAGQLLARLGTQVERAAVSVAEGRARADAELQAAVAAHQLAVSKLRRSRDLLQQQFIAPLALEQAEAEERVAAHRVAQAREAQTVARRELGLSQAQLGQREVRSPFDGVVVERYRTEGERVEREPIVRIARIDPLRVEVLVPSSHFGSIQPGQSLQVRAELPQWPALQARVTLVDRVIDPASNSFRVRLALPNPDLAVPAGLRCKVDLAAPVQPPQPSQPPQQSSLAEPRSSPPAAKAGPNAPKAAATTAATTPTVAASASAEPAAPAAAIAAVMGVPAPRAAAAPSARSQPSAGPAPSVASPAQALAGRGGGGHAVGARAQTATPDMPHRLAAAARARAALAGWRLSRLWPVALRGPARQDLPEPTQPTAAAQGQPLGPQRGKPVPSPVLSGMPPQAAAAAPSAGHPGHPGPLPRVRVAQQ